MFNKLKKLFKNEEKPDINSFEKKFPVGSWYRSGVGIIRLSNVYINKINNRIEITLETPVLNSNNSGFRISKDDGISIEYLIGWNRVEAKEAAQLERSYWKTIENDLMERTHTSNKFYNDFLKVGGK